MKDIEKVASIIFLSALILINIWMVVTDAQPWFISSLNILFHEAGHWIFGFFGEFIQALGGTLGELLMPFVFVLYFKKTLSISGQVFSWWWFSTALYDISIYIADARARVLPLIGGQDGHDWAYLLGELGLLNFDIVISQLFLILFLLVTVYMIFLLYHYIITIK